MKRPLKIDFDLYTDGDTLFKDELVILLINNLVELQQGLTKSIDNDPSLFRITSHKVKPSLTILNDSEFSMLVEALNHPPFDTEKCKSFKQISDDIITSLQLELGIT